MDKISLKMEEDIFGDFEIDWEGYAGILVLRSRLWHEGAMHHHNNDIRIIARDRLTVEKALEFEDLFFGLDVQQEDTLNSSICFFDDFISGKRREGRIEKIFFHEFIFETIVSREKMAKED